MLGSLRYSKQYILEEFYKENKKLEESTTFCKQLRIHGTLDSFHQVSDSVRPLDNLKYVNQGVMLKSHDRERHRDIIQFGEATIQ